MHDRTLALKKAVCLTLWFPVQNNPRYTVLFAQLAPLVAVWKLTLSERRWLRGLQYRAWNLLSRRVIYPVAIKYFARHYDTLFTVSYDQIAAWPKGRSVVIDIDDPVFSQTEVDALNLPQVKAVVVTTEKAKRIFEQKGVVSPIYIVPQGVPVIQTDRQRVARIRKEFRKPNDVVLGYHAPTLTMAADGSRRPRGDQDDLDFLFQAFDDARRAEPRLKLWLFGKPSNAVRKHVLAKSDSSVALFGYVSLSEIFNYLANVDIGVYPRTWNPPPGRFSIKIAQFMACGIPVVSRDLDESFIIKTAACGIVCQSQADFSEALLELARSPDKRAQLGDAGRFYAQTKLDWSVLAPLYKKIVAA